MSYVGYVTQLKELRPHSNADRLQIGTVFGSNVILSLDYKEGDVVIYFPTDGQLSEEYCKANNLIRILDADGNNIGGYLDENKRNITAIKLRGEKSDGLALPLSSLSPFGDISTLKVGDTIDIFNGTLICNKYIPRKQNSQKNVNFEKTKKLKKVKHFPFFHEHIDTKQLMYNLHEFKEGDICTISLKMHGCFIAGTKIRMADGTLKPIQHIEIGDTVLGYNLNSKTVEPTKVLQVFHNDKSNNWRKIKISRNGMKGERKGGITCTPNHPFWVEEKNKYIEAQDLQVGMKVSTLFPTKILTQIQKDIMIGSLLGDGCLMTFNNCASEMQLSSKKDHEAYQDYLIDICDGLLYKNNKEYKSGYGTTIVRSKTYRSADLYKYFNDVYNFNKQDGNKLLKGIINKITPLSMAIFYMDDGSLQHTKHQKDRATFSICDYNDNDAEIICECFRKFGIEPVLYKGYKNYNNIRLNTQEAYKFFDLIQEFIPPIMRYKLPQEYQNLKFEKFKKTEKMYDGYVLVQQEVLGNTPITKLYKEYDMETELHNYVVGLSIVHNTSVREAHTIKVTDVKPKWYERLFKRKGRQIKEWDVVAGSRRVVLDFDKGDKGYYGTHDFRKNWHDVIAPKLHKGENFYAECVGFISENTLVMPQCDNSKTKDKEFIKRFGNVTEFTYGCEKGENKVYGYRMTKTDEDGNEVEYPTWYAKIRTEQMGLEFVPILEQFVYTTEEDLLNRVNKYLDIEDPIGKTHVAEGVVVRVENRHSFTAYKIKGWYFRVLEGIIKNDAIEADIEESQDLV